MARRWDVRMVRLTETGSVYSAMGLRFYSVAMAGS